MKFGQFVANFIEKVSVKFHGDGGRGCGVVGVEAGRVIFLSFSLRFKRST